MIMIADNSHHRLYDIANNITKINIRIKKAETINANTP